MAIKHEIRANGDSKTKVIMLTARKAIQAHCKECMGFDATLVKGCTDNYCALYPFRTRETPQNTC